jgi:nucleotidyltransferase substrate binding protein (TIGR01987 family)
MKQDTRWKQRYSNFKKALTQLERFMEKEELNEMEEQGLIQAFEYTFELAWKTLQDILEEESGYSEIRGPRPAIMQAFRDGYISHGEKWMEMLKDRNRTVHSYNEKIAKEIIHSIKNEYSHLSDELNKKFRELQ